MDEQALRKFMIEKAMREKYPKAALAWSEGELEFLQNGYEKFVAEGGTNLAKFIKPVALELQRNPYSLEMELKKMYQDQELPHVLNSRSSYKPAEPKAAFLPRYKEEDAPVVIDFSGNMQAAEVIDLLENTKKNLFMTGRAGTGKSTLLNYFRSVTKKNVVVLAPTGIAALNVGGQTIHSFCSFPADITISRVKKLAPWSPKVKLLPRINTIVIDEVSMVRADLMDCLDRFLRLNTDFPTLPFGGIQIVLIGDLYQLPPVDRDFSIQNESRLLKEYNSPYFFESRAFAQTEFSFIELTRVYRQQDGEFLDLLNAIRNNQASQSHLALLNSRHSEDTEIDQEDFAIWLTATNAQATAINQHFINRVEGVQKNYTGRLEGDFNEKNLPTDMVLSLKTGSQVMLLNNDREGRWVNGTMGSILEIIPKSDEDSNDTLLVQLENGKEVEVHPHTWEMYKYAAGKEGGRIESEIVGTFTQFPLKLAWAVTIHKSQGKTFSRVYIDLGRGTFAHGQLYVALSRCRTLDGITLKQPIEPRHIIIDARVGEFLKRYQ